MEPSDGLGVDWQELFEEFPRGIGVLDSDGRCLYGNDRLKDLFLEETDRLVLRHEPVRNYWNEFLTSFLDDSRGHDSVIVVIPDQDGADRWCSFKLIRNTRTSRIFLSEEDVTEQHLYEEQLLNARDEAEKATRTKSEFLANMSHEIRTPIHTIIGMAELMNTTALDQEQEEYSSQIRFSADVLLSLINDILDFSKIEAGQLHLEFTECDLLNLMEDSTDLVALEAHNRSVEVGCFADPGTDFYIQGDPTRLRQIVVNLVNNAVKFTEEGQVMVYLSRMAQDDASVTLRFSVEDSGIGISDEKKARLFDAFTQADSSTTRRYGGSGLGLTICRNLVKQMGGELEVESSEGIGSEFFFTLTFPRIRPGEELPEQYEYGDDLKGVSILLVDDNWKIREVLVSYLSSWGCRVDEAGSGREAFQKMKWKVKNEGRSYDICITDQLMPDIDGWQLASQVRAHDSLKNSALILMSLKGRGTEEAKMKLLGWFSAYINKPVRKKDLWDKCILALFPDKAEPGFLEELEQLPVPQGDRSPAVPGLAGGSGKILVAEDHPVNRKLFESILVKQGYSVILAENGKEALEKAELEKPDLIFMDCQMPVMNGYEATKRIRKLNIRIPIVAVTANALKGEQDKCRDAGMNDFLPKPFKQRDLQPVLRKWLSGGQGGAVPVSPSVISLETGNGSEEPEELEEIEELEELEEPVADPAVFDYQQALDTFLGDRELLLSLLEPFVEQVEQQVSTLEAPGQMENMDEVAAAAHSIKGSSRNLSMEELGNAAEVIESAGKKGDRKAAEEALPGIREAFVRVRESLAPFLEEGK